MTSLIEKIRGETDLPVSLIGIHSFGDSTNPRMYTGKDSAWLQEDSVNQPWNVWSVPVSSRPRQEVRWKDVIILDENNEFFAVQNLAEEALSSGPNRTKLKSALLAASSITDTDLDGISDRWEFQQLGDIGSGANTTLPNGESVLVNYAMSLSSGSLEDLLPSIEIRNDNGERYLRLEYRRRLGLEGSRLIYEPQISSDGENWMGGEDTWNPVSVTNPWDGSGTEIVTVETMLPEGSIPLMMSRVRVESPL